MSAAVITLPASFFDRPERYNRPPQPAPIIDLLATGDGIRAARATGQDVTPLIPAQITVRIGDWVYDDRSKFSGFLCRYLHRDGHTKAVINVMGLAIVAQLPDLRTVLTPHH